MKNVQAVAELRVLADLIESQDHECIDFIDVKMTVENGAVKHHIVVAFTDHAAGGEYE